MVQDRLNLLLDRLDWYKMFRLGTMVQYRLDLVQMVQDHLDWVQNYFLRVCDRLSAKVFLLFHVVGLWALSFFYIVLYGVNIFALCSIFEKTVSLVPLSFILFI